MSDLPGMVKPERYVVLSVGVLPSSFRQLRSFFLKLIAKAATPEGSSQRPTLRPREPARTSATPLLARHEKQAETVADWSCTDVSNDDEISA